MKTTKPEIPEESSPSLLEFHGNISDIISRKKKNLAHTFIICEDPKTKDLNVL